jgi:excisionase family DNA binding protein
MGTIPELMTVEQAAVWLLVSERTLYTYLRRGTLPGRRIGRRWYINPEAVLALVGGRPADRDEAARRLLEAGAEEASCGNSL